MWEQRGIGRHDDDDRSLVSILRNSCPLRATNTTDADVVIDPRQLTESPEPELALREAGFR